MIPNLVSNRLIVTSGIDTQRFSILHDITSMYEELQLCSVEASFPQEDLFTFACRTAFFGVICLRSQPRAEQNLWLKDEVPLHTVIDSSRSSTQVGSASSPFHSTQQNLPSDVGSDEAGLPIGLAYLIPTQAPPFPPGGSLGELSLGIIITDAHRQRGYAKEALGLVLEEAFRNMGCHRVQVNLLDTFAKEEAMRLLMSMRFVYEGQRRRAFYSMVEQEWKDTTCLAVLDTDWMVRSKFLTKAAPKTLWDEMLSRHEKEREKLIQWEDGQTQSWPKWLKRTSSVETIRSAIFLSDYKEANTSGSESTPPSDSEGGQSDVDDRFSQFLRQKGKEKAPKRSLEHIASDSQSDPFAIELSSDAEHEGSSPPKTRRISRSIPYPEDRLPLFSDAEDDFFAPTYPHPRAPSPSLSLRSFATAPSPSPSISSNDRRSPSLSSASDIDTGSEDNEDGGYASSTPSSQWDLISEMSDPSRYEPF
ncbi:hypothetical protein BDP27DRAFT_1325328 [Rhodocollybia butyracea]|uniref:N-acetyltransferase domain-containing protein n=1 Tax=Rhodocollybia butyracea TaxID=206335 RepID=A0A9P5PVT2_9AGAR|nr:hypothetical protein BDP27DRAFT_1325328 [Rhodocollybia butyracea]